MPYVLFLLVCSIWGSNFILMKKAAAAFGPLSIGTLRAAGGAAVLVLLWRWQGGAAGFHRRHWRPLAFVALAGYAWPYAIQPYLVARHGSAFIGMTVSLVPIFTILVCIPILGQLPTRRQVVGVVGGLICMAAILGDGLRRAVPPLDLLLAASVPFVYAVTNAWIRKRLHDVPPLALACLVLAVCGATLAPASLATERVETAELPAAPVCVALLSFLGTGLSNYWFTRLLQDHGPLFAGMVTYLVPVGAVVWGWADREPITAVQLAALAGIFAMVGLVQYGAAGAGNPKP